MVSEERVASVFSLKLEAARYQREDVELVQTLSCPIHEGMESKKSTAFWIVMPCSLVEVHQYFRGTYCLHLQGQGLSQARSRQHAFLLAGYSQYIPPKYH
jgi:hypothetical protein